MNIHSGINSKETSLGLRSEAKESKQQDRKCGNVILTFVCFRMKHLHSPFPLFEVNAARRSRASLNRVESSKLTVMYEHP